MQPDAERRPQDKGGVPDDANGDACIIATGEDEGLDLDATGLWDAGSDGIDAG